MNDRQLETVKVAQPRLPTPPAIPGGQYSFTLGGQGFTTFFQTHLRIRKYSDRDANPKHVVNGELKGLRRT